MTDAPRRGAPRWLAEADVVSLVDLADAIVAVEDGLRLEAQGLARNLDKTVAPCGPGASLQALGAVLDPARLAGVKSWVQSSAGVATPILVLWDAENGALQALIEASALGRLRTGAIAGVATRWLAAGDAGRMAVIGSGRQALMQVAAVAAVRPLRRLAVFSPTLEHRRRFAERLAAEFGIDVLCAHSVEEAVAGAEIISLATRAEEPFLSAAMVSAGAHINAVGATIAARAEFTTDLFPRCARVVVDTPEGARRLSAEFRAHYGVGDAAWTEVVRLSSIIGSRPERTSGRDLTLFKALGMGLSDLSLARLALDRAAERGVGRELAAPGDFEPRLLGRTGPT